mgnify:CR=1 FL=1
MTKKWEDFLAVDEALKFNQNGWTCKALQATVVTEGNDFHFNKIIKVDNVFP